MREITCADCRLHAHQCRRRHTPRRSPDRSPSESTATPEEGFSPTPPELAVLVLAPSTLWVAGRLSSAMTCIRLASVGWPIKITELARPPNTTSSTATLPPVAAIRKAPAILFRDAQYAASPRAKRLEPATNCTGPEASPRAKKRPLRPMARITRVIGAALCSTKRPAIAKAGVPRIPAIAQKRNISRPRDWIDRDPVRLRERHELPESTNCDDFPRTTVSRVSNFALKAELASRPKDGSLGNSDWARGQITRRDARINALRKLRNIFSNKN